MKKKLKTIYVNTSLLGSIFSSCLSLCYGMDNDIDRETPTINSLRAYHVEGWMSKAEKSGDLASLNNLGLLMQQEEKVYQPLLKKHQLHPLLKAAALFYVRNHEDPETWCKLGKLHEEGKIIPQNYKEAYIYFENARQMGQATASRHLGHLYYQGNGVSQDYTKAREHFEEAETRGYEDGDMFNTLGLIYGKDKETYAKAVYYYEKARKKGYAVGGRNLGMYYYQGNGVSQDYTKAREYFEEAETREYKDGWMFNTLGLIHDGGKEVEKNYDTANSYFEKAREQGYAAASRNLGTSYYQGNGVSQDYTKAREYFEEAETRGYKEGWMFNTLGNVYHNGNGVPKDYTKANSYFAKARAEGHAGASRNLGMFYYEGKGVSQDYTKAREYLEEAATRGYKEGWMFKTLGDIYYYGYGLSSYDTTKANQWYAREKECK